jgi:uncharacterized protein (DUF2235 family)
MLETITRSLLMSALAIWVLLTVGCSSIAVKEARAIEQGPRKIAIFFDGTHNDEASDTNIKRLHSLVTLQARNDIAAIYIEGVGTGRDFLGMTMGVGIKARVKIAYQFLWENYRPEEKDQIYIFGFSRGAYSARMLASLLYYAGLPRAATLPANEITDRVYSEMMRYDESSICEERPGDTRCTKKGPTTATLKDDRKEKVRGSLERMGMTSFQSVPVEVLGLWDTVEALGFPDWTARLRHKAGGTPFFVNIDYPNVRHGDQLCNVRRAFHALSIDDDREWVFTPLLLTRNHLFRNCEQSDRGYILSEEGKILPGRLQEVWFSGAHADVGGGYPDSLLSGVSLNWMINQLNSDAEINLLPRDARVAEDSFGSSHNPEGGMWGPLYHEMTRNIGAYVSDSDKHRSEFFKSICVHQSVQYRRAVMLPAWHENDLLQFGTGGQACLLVDTRRNKNNPDRLRATNPCAPSPDNVVVEFWPHCKGIQ